MTAVQNDLFQSLVSQARIMFEDGDIKASLDLCNKAYKLKPCPKLLKKINKIELFIQSEEKENSVCTTSSNDSSVKVSPSCPKSICFQELVSTLIHNASAQFEAENISGSLQLLNEAYEHAPSERLAARIDKVKSLMKNISNDGSNHMISKTSPTCGHNEQSSEYFVQKARELYHDQQFTECINCLQRAQQLNFSDKVQRKIERIQAYLENACPEEVVSSKSDVFPITQDFFIPRLLYEKLYPYQQDGVRWLWSLHNTGPGGVLADDMGLGKTVQVIAFLSGLFTSQRRKCTVLIIMPVTVLVTWEGELKKWAPTLRVVVFHDGNKTSRLRALSTIQRHGGILLTTYGMVVTNAPELATDMNADPQFIRGESHLNGRVPTLGQEFHWTYKILDEAHRIKNPAAKTTKAILGISAEHIVLLTGTAVQNNLRELWSLYNCTHAGRLLGRMQTFKREYENPITRAREKDASRAEKAHGQLMAQSLRKLIDPFFLRRTKAEVSKNKETDVGQLVEEISTDVSRLNLESLPKKTELVVWIYLREVQERSYRNFLESDEVKQLLMRTDKRSPLMQLLILKKLCDHPRLLSPDQCVNLNIAVSPTPDGSYSKILLPPAAQLAEESGKIYFLSLLLNSFLHESECSDAPTPRTLVFSQSLRLLDIAEKVILALNKKPENISASRKHRVLRLDGRLTKVEERMDMIRRFEKDTSYTVMLLTTQVGGVGLTLTAANRVIILDPSWNPATDAQAVDRAYRIGQTSDVIVYRLITCGTVEEKIYRRQIFKESIIRQTTSTGHSKTDVDPFRYFTRQDLRELFGLNDCKVSKTQQQLSKLHEATEKWADKTISPHLTYLTGPEHKDVIFGLSFHDLMFSREEIQSVEIQLTEAEVVREQKFLYNRLIAAEHAIECECTDPSAPLQPAAVKSDVNSKYIAPYQPVDGLFMIPTKVDSKRPMLNRPRLGNYPIPRNVAHQPVPPKVKSPVAPAEAESEYESSSADELVTSLQQIDICTTEPKSGLNTAHSVIQILSDNERSDEEKNAETNSSSLGRANSHGHDTQPNSSCVTPDRISDALATSLREMSISHRLVTPESGTKHGSTSPHLSDSGHSVSSPLPSHPAFLLSAMNCVSRSTPAGAVDTKELRLLLTPFSKPPVTKQCLSSPTDGSAKRSSGPPVDVNTSVKSVGEVHNPDEFIHMDITATVDDDELMRTVDIKSVHEVLAKSGLLDQPMGKDGSVTSETSSILSVADSCVFEETNNVSVGTSVVEDSVSEFDIIEDSVVD